METTLKTLGMFGEELACDYLAGQGYKLLLRNYTCDLGEIDLIAKEQGALVFIEVKTRRSLEMGEPAESVTFHKRRQIVKAARYYLKRYGIHDVACRFDVVSVLLKGEDAPKVDVIRDAFREGE